MLKAKTAFLAAGFALAAALPGWAQDTATGDAATAAPAMDVSADTVLASVNGAEVTLGHVIATRQALPAQYQALPDEVLLEGILEQLIQQTVLSQAMGSLSHRTEIELENERRALIAGEKLDEVTAAAVTDEALQKAYDETYGSAAPETEYNASHILVATEEEAADLIKQLDAGADFAELAKEHSTGPSGPSGGELGWFTQGMMVKPFEDAVIALDVGQIGGPLQTQFGWHVIKLNDKRDAAKPTLDEVRDDLTSQIESDAIDKAVSELVDAADITRVDLAAIDPAELRNDALLDGTASE